MFLISGFRGPGCWPWARDEVASSQDELRAGGRRKGEEGSRVDTFQVCGCAAGGLVCDLTEGGLRFRPSCVALGKARGSLVSVLTW